eukprot:3670574-Prymnesium_polylepis.1
MIGEFLQQGSPRQVCVGDVRVKAVLDGVEASGAYTRDMFDIPEEIAYGTLKLVIFPRFEVTPEALKLFEERDNLVEPDPACQQGGRKREAYT